MTVREKRKKSVNEVKTVKNINHNHQRFQGNSHAQKDVPSKQTGRPCIWLTKSFPIKGRSTVMNKLLDSI